MPDSRRHLPSVDQVLQHCHELLTNWGHPQVSGFVREELSRRRARVQQNATADEPTLLAVDDIVNSVGLLLEQRDQSTLVPVFNLSGTILHTNLGRAVLPEAAIDAMNQVARRASNLEFDLSTGKRGDRDDHIESLLCELSGAEAATVVNNNAAAVLLVLNTLAINAEVPVSRGELVEIGGSFRIPDVMARAPCKLVEVGATNRTHLKDYANAINERTALLMKVHTSNFYIQGFTKSVAEADLSELAKQLSLPFVIDLGSGNLVDMTQFGLPAEPTVKQSLDYGADLVTFSGDKLLGGPQCGIIAGRKDLVEKIKANPLKRALRVDKLTIAALTEVLKLYRHPEKLIAELPTLRQLNKSAAEIEAQAQRLLPAWQAILPAQYISTVEPSESQVGSGALPTSSLSSYALCTRACSDKQVSQLLANARALPTPVIGRLNDGCFSLDLRCLEDEAIFINQLPLLGDALKQ
ncbi:MAG: L-seryl-tRNA(Sec) selenium transferase [Pseudomonadota bacterium]